MQSAAKIEIRPRDIRPGRGATFFSVENICGAYDFMATLDRCEPQRMQVGQGRFLKVFEWGRLEGFLAYAAQSGVEVVRP